MNVLFDMETGDPDDLITLLLLLNNPTVALQGITCYQGSPIQIGLIQHVLKLAGQTDIPVGGWNCAEPSELSPYYTNVVGSWAPAQAQYSPVEVFKSVFERYPDTHVLTGAPLTNLAHVVNHLPELVIPRMTTQGGYIGALVAPEKKLSKFKNKSAYRTYNLGQDPSAFDAVNNSQNIKNLTFITKDLCHGFSYTPDIDKNIKFGSSPVSQLLKKCLQHYTLGGKSKAMHDPLAMLIMLEESLGTTATIQMAYHTDERGYMVFSSRSVPANINQRSALVNYETSRCWDLFGSLCADKPPIPNIHMGKNKP